ncbi:E3 ubiquitin-protein ligase makorin-1 isoform X2 [Spea bombifrons]|uniref:E3 ubiquitin-protein ligase makorin-1 isoform X2 n=1 Tax=Spea bombifrons TaxID=233779 RepID=UPI002349A406|nr:E3 ubiquitin-protein ligase makorin-1 isoform X2 [Spea bombifrons]
MAEAAAAPASLTSAAAVAAGKAPLLAFPDNPPVGGWTRQVTCRYFMHGVCKEGNNCRYSHDLSTSRSTMICRYYQRGCCAYGDHCRYEHTKPLKQEPTGDTSAARICPRESHPEPSSTNNSPSVLEAVTQGTETRDDCMEQPADPELKKQLCPYAAVGECRYGENCVYLHGDPCDMCGLQVLHPVDTSQRSQHIKSCIEAHEKDMELSFAIQRSKDVVCGVCMEVIYEKVNPSERRFGILSNCSHAYCLKCIRKWRSAKQFESKIIKSCPECRITSNFVIPSEYWVEEKEEKQKLIQKYKEAMGNKSCRYFDEGRGTCPFGGNCFYKHAYPDGRIEEPQPRQKGGMSSRYRAQRRNRFWDFEERENGDVFDNDEDEVVTFELGEMLLMLLAAGADEDLTDSEDEWDLFHEELDDFYDLDL